MASPARRSVAGSRWRAAARSPSGEAGPEREDEDRPGERREAQDDRQEVAGHRRVEGPEAVHARGTLPGRDLEGPQGGQARGAHRPDEPPGAPAVHEEPPEDEGRTVEDRGGLDEDGGQQEHGACGEPAGRQRVPAALESAGQQGDCGPKPQGDHRSVHPNERVPEAQVKGGEVKGDARRRPGEAGAPAQEHGDCRGARGRPGEGHEPCGDERLGQPDEGRHEHGQQRPVGRGDGNGPPRVEATRVLEGAPRVVEEETLVGTPIPGVGDEDLGVDDVDQHHDKGRRPRDRRSEEDPAVAPASGRARGRRDAHAFPGPPRPLELERRVGEADPSEPSERATGVMIARARSLRACRCR